MPYERDREKNLEYQRAYRKRNAEALQAAWVKKRDEEKALFKGEDFRKYKRVRKRRKGR